MTCAAIDRPGALVLVGNLPVPTATVTLTTLQRTADWFQVDYHGTQGWVSAEHVSASGDCG